jgi:hypothetical protein
LSVEAVLLTVSIEGILLEPLYYKAEVLYILLGSLTIDEYIIQVDHVELIQIVREGLINIRLERR